MDFRYSNSTSSFKEFILSRAQKLSSSVRKAGNYKSLESNRNIFETSSYKTNFKKRKKKARQFMVEDWLSEKNSVDGNYLAVPRPFGHKCKLVILFGRTYLVSDLGEVTEVSAINLEGEFGKVVLEVICSEDTYYLLDLLVWNELDLSVLGAEERFSLLKSKFTKIHFKSRAEMLPAYSCDFSGLMKAYESPDLKGILFYHKQSTYNPGVNLWVKFWTDRAVEDEFVLYVKGTGELKTFEGYTLGDVDLESFYLVPGVTVICKFANPGFNPKVLRRAESTLADPLSKIKYKCISLEDILESGINNNG